MYSFGAGVLWGTRTDVANATPLNFGLVQEVTIEETATIKELIGQYQRPVAIARASIKTTGKAKVARISGLAFANLFYGVTPTAGQISTAFGETATIPSATPWTVTVANSATWVETLEVYYAATGLPFQLVASAPTVGQYSVAAGVYTFSTTDAGKAVIISYKYTIPTVGQKFTVANQLLGTTPTFKASFHTTFQGLDVNLTLNNCTASKLSFQTKLEDFVIPEFDFSCFADAANNVMTWSFEETS